MSNEELVKEIQSEHDRQENLTLLYQQNIPFIRKVVKIFAQNEEDMQDLMQESFFAIEKAADRYNTEQDEASFLTYAIYYIRSQCGTYAYNNHAIHIPTNTLQQISSYRKILNTYKKEHGELPTDDYIMNKMGMNKKQYKKFLVEIASCYVRSLDEKVSSDEESLTIGETLVSKEDFAAEIESNSLNECLWEQVEGLDDPKQTKVINMMFKEGKTQLQIAEELHVSGSRVQQIENKGLKILRKSARVKEIAGYYGYNSCPAYNYTMTRFKNTRTSSVEFLALKRMDFEEQVKECDDTFNEIMNAM